MEFILGLYVGLATGYLLRGVVSKLELTIRQYGIPHGPKNRRH